MMGNNRHRVRIIKGGTFKFTVTITIMKYVLYRLKVTATQAAAFGLPTMNRETLVNSAIHYEFYLPIACSI